MDLYVRVNIRDGKSVRLPRGDIEDFIVLDNDPVSRAKTWVEQGADLIHVVDLDAAARGDYRNRGLIDRLIREAGRPVQVGGGVRSELEAARLLDAGASKVVMGTSAIENQIMVWELCRRYPGQIAVSVDAQADEEVVTRGWTQNSGRFLEEVLVEMSSAGAAAFMVSEAGRDALSEPPNIDLLRTALGIIEEPVIASGGARNLDDLLALKALENNGRTLAGVVVGREVSYGRFSIAEAKAAIS